MKTAIKISFKSKNQTPYLMIIKEYYYNGAVEHATVLYLEDEYESDIFFTEDFHTVNEYRVERKAEL